MAENNLNNIRPGGETLRKVKKIKRPIKRLVPGNPMSPATPPNKAPIRPQPNVSINKKNVDLDELLDSQLNLPALKNPNSTQPHSDNRTVPTENEQTNYQRPNRFLSESDFEEKPRFWEDLMQGNLFTLKGVAVISVLIFIVGILVAKIFSGGQTIVKDGLQGVVVNAEVPRGRARCGIAERTQGCVLYIMNPQRQDLQGRDFYDLASQLTGRQRFVIETGNMRYSGVKIKPGDIAQINSPPLQ